MQRFGKNSIVSLVVFAFLLPQITFAAWWNPLSWGWSSFFNPSKTIIDPTVTQSTSTPSNQPIKKPPSTSTVSLSNAQIIKNLKPAVVYIDTKYAAGSGMIIDEKGYVLTNAHVVEGVDYASITLSDGNTYTASVTGKDENLDVAVLQIIGEKFPTVVFGNSDFVSQGDSVYALGFPFGIKGDVSFTNGVISRRVSEDGVAYLEVTADFHPGSSGGPLVNQQGKVIGINSQHYFGGIAEQLTGAGTLKRSIPINVALAIILRLEKGLFVKSPKSSSTITPKPIERIAPSSKTELVGRFPLYINQVTKEPIVDENGHNVLAGKIPPFGSVVLSLGAYSSQIWTDKNGNVYAAPAPSESYRAAASGLWFNGDDRFLAPPTKYSSSDCLKFGQSNLCYSYFLEQ